MNWQSREQFLMLCRSYPLRYVLKNRDTGEIYFVVVFTMLSKDEVEDEEERAQGGVKDEGTGGPDGDAFEPQPDDVD